MTEDEAKTKLCPKSLQPISDGMGCITNCDCYCRGSQCMAWRISERARPSDIERKYIEWKDGEEKPSTEFLECGWVLTDSGTVPADEEDGYILHWEDYERVAKAACPEEGYCGLAGKPPSLQD